MWKRVFDFICSLIVWQGALLAMLDIKILFYYPYDAKTMKGKEILKRIFFGKLSPLPNEIEEGMCEYTPPVQISYDSPNHQYKILYAVAHLLHHGQSGK